MEKNENRVINVCEAYYALVENVTSTTKVSGYKMAVVLDGGVTWEQIPFSPGTGVVSEKAVRKNAGICFEQSFQAEIAGEDDVIPEWLGEIDGRPCVLKIVQSNGTKIYGSVTYPVRLMCEWGTEKSSVTIGFSANSTERARWYDESDDSGSGL